ncbi:hypothetical protein LX81_00587 [Palleronia aestuarii]|uniref:Uncharacterized protein n=1 Tax=Palleronia aestuarii TaxID=568105 RepID=A0A2W7NQI5_9RHOB|nr:hypothetical protein [Palleronia aestuarii]PZX18894.1 hypothetical protein LX81_00587 [Palleronia aestuarii]
MLAGPLLQARLTARLVARRAVFGSIGGVCLLIGAGFMVAAIWILLDRAYGPLAAALVLAVIFCGLGFCILAFSRIPPRVVPREAAQRMADPRMAPPPTGLTSAGLISAFLWGLNAGRGVRRRR